jgi:hypothetical protein
MGYTNLTTGRLLVEVRYNLIPQASIPWSTMPLPMKIALLQRVCIVPLNNSYEKYLKNTYGTSMFFPV